jgi:hypothetical protein
VPPLVRPGATRKRRDIWRAIWPTTPLRLRHAGRGEAEAELPPPFVCLHDDRCQCPHMGYVIKGRLNSPSLTETKSSTRPMRRTTRPRDTCRALRRDRRRRIQRPTAELQKTLDVVSKNMGLMITLPLLMIKLAGPVLLSTSVRAR